MSRRYSEQEKTQALAALNAGQRVTDVAADFGVSPTTLRRWAKAAETPAEPTVQKAAELPPGETPETEEKRPLQLVVIDSAGDTARLARILDNERLPIQVTPLNEHAYAEQIATSYSWHQACRVLDLEPASLCRVFDLLRRSGRPLPRILVNQGPTLECRDAALIQSETLVIDRAALPLLGSLLDREQQIQHLRVQTAEYEAQTRVLQACYQRAFDASQEPIAVIDTTGHRYANAAFLDMIDCKAVADLQSKSFSHLIADRSMQDYLNAVDALQQAGACVSLDLILRCGVRAQVEITRLPGHTREHQLRFSTVTALQNSDSSNAVFSRERLPGSTAQPVTPENVTTLRSGLDDEQWTDRIQRALQDPNLFSLLYQPIVGLSGDPSHMYEALLRMRDSSGAEFLPGKFIPAAKAAGLMHKIDQWVITRALKVIKSQSAQDAPVTICVNLSHASLVNDGFSDWLGKALETLGTDPARMILEVSCNDLEKQFEQAQLCLARIRRIGCPVALDDFSTAQAEGGLLDKIKADYVKIDRALVLEVARSDLYLQRIKNLIKTAEAAQVKTIAAYVQEANSVTRLWSCGVNYVQGYFLQHPSNALDYDFGGDEHEVPSTEWALLM